MTITNERLPSIFGADSDFGNPSVLIQIDNNVKTYLVVFFEEMTIDIWTKKDLGTRIDIECVLEINDDFTEERLGKIYKCLTGNELLINDIAQEEPTRKDLTLEYFKSRTTESRRLRAVGIGVNDILVAHNYVTNNVNSIEGSYDDVLYWVKIYEIDSVVCSTYTNYILTFERAQQLLNEANNIKWDAWGLLFKFRKFINSIILLESESYANIWYINKDGKTSYLSFVFPLVYSNIKELSKILTQLGFNVDN